VTQHWAENLMKYVLVPAFVLALASAVYADVVPEPPAQILEDIEDVRLLFCLASYQVHELETTSSTAATCRS